MHDTTFSNCCHPVSLTEALNISSNYADVVNGQFKWHFATHPQFPYRALKYETTPSAFSDIHVACLPIVFLHCYTTTTYNSTFLYIRINNLTAMYPWSFISTTIIFIRCVRHMRMRIT